VPLLLKILISLTFLYFVIRRVELAPLLENLAHLNLGFALTAFAVMTCGGVAGSLSWYYVICSSNMNLKFLSVLRLYWRGMLLNSAMPSNIGGDVYKGWALSRNSNVSVADAASTLIVDRVLNFSLLIMIGVISLSLVHGAWLWTFAVTLFFVLMFVGLSLLAFKLKDIPVGSNRFILFFGSLLSLYQRPQCFFRTIIAAALAQFLKIGCHFFVIRALALNIDAAVIWYIIPLFGVLSALPVSVGGLGLRESAAVLIATPTGCVTEDLVALSLAGHLLFLLVNLLGVFAFVRSASAQEGDRA